MYCFVSCFVVVILCIELYCVTLYCQYNCIILSCKSYISVLHICPAYPGNGTGSPKGTLLVKESPKGLLSPESPLFTHGPQRWNHGSTDGLFLLLLLLHTTKFSNWFDFPGNSSDSYLFLLLLLLFPGMFLSGELSTPVQRTVHSLQAVQ